MKYRIKQINDEYCPQFKFLFWRYYTHDYTGYTTIESFSTLGSARGFLENQEIIDKPVVHIYPYPWNTQSDKSANHFAKIGYFATTKIKVYQITANMNSGWESKT